MKLAPSVVNVTGGPGSPGRRARGPREPLSIAHRRTLDDVDCAVYLDRIAGRRFGHLIDANIDRDRLGNDARLAELQHPIRPAHDYPHQHPGIGAAGAKDGVAAKVRIGEQRVDRFREGGHQLLEVIFTARRGRLLMGSTEASVLTSMALPSGRAS